MPLFLKNLPMESAVSVVLVKSGGTYYKTSIPILQRLTGNMHIIPDNLALGDAWVLLGYKGKLPNPLWMTSIVRSKGRTPVAYNAIVPRLLGNNIGVIKTSY